MIAGWAHMARGIAVIFLAVFSSPGSAAENPTPEEASAKVSAILSRITVHAEWINRPSVVIVDKEGVARFAYHGTFWGDRPSIHQLLEMVRSGNYSFAVPKRLKEASMPR